MKCSDCGNFIDEHAADCASLSPREPTDPGPLAVLHVDTDEEPVDDAEALK